jgi:hypothetical protein
MIFYGIADGVSDRIEDWYLSREKAEATLARILRDGDAPVDSPRGH